MKDRHLELSSKFVEMGRALIKEGHETNDYSVTQVGNWMVLMGSLLLDDNDVQEFTQVCSMFSAKKVLDNMKENEHDYIQFLSQKSNAETYENFIKRINKLRGDNGHTPIS